MNKIQYLFVFVFIIVVIMEVFLFNNDLVGGNYTLSPNISPADMLQSPLKVLHNGCRFQNPMKEPIAYSSTLDNNLNHHERVGVFKSSRYYDSG